MKMKSSSALSWLPFDGTFQNHQAEIPVVIQKDSDQYDHSDFFQHWQNGIEYIFLQIKRRGGRTCIIPKGTGSRWRNVCSLLFPQRVGCCSSNMKPYRRQIGGLFRKLRQFSKGPVLRFGRSLSWSKFNKVGKMLIFIFISGCGSSNTFWLTEMHRWPPLRQTMFFGKRHFRSSRARIAA
jgi:hypothetical protein